MIKLPNVLTGLFLITLLSGCGTTPISSRDADSVPSGRHVAFKSAAAGTVPVVITRDTGIMGAACAATILVNNETAAHIRSGETVTLHIPTGDVILGAQAGTICGGGLVEIEVKLQAGKQRQYRVGLDGAGSLGLFPTASR